jgi:thiamine pyrophosphokinase
LNDWLIVANGAPASSDCLMKWSKDRRVCVCDGAYAKFKKSGIAIDMVAGDFDSIASKDLNDCRSLPDIECVNLSDQSQTDLEKAMGLLDQRGTTSIVVVQSTGFRVDHTLYNLRLLRRFYQNCRPLVLVNDAERITYHCDCEIRLIGTFGQRVSIMAMDTAIVSTQGLLYDMSEYKLGLGYKDSVSNSLSQSQAVLSVCGEVILIIDGSININ